MIHIWTETGGDTGGLELYASEPHVHARIDWDDWEEKTRDLSLMDFDQIFEWLEEFGHVMPKRTRKLLLTFLQPDEKGGS